MDESLRLERARVEDLEEIARVHRDAWVETYTGIYPQSRFDSEGHQFFLDYWRPEFADADPSRLNLVVRTLEVEDEPIVAVGVLIPASQSDTGYAELDRLYVASGYRGRGIGTNCMEVLRRHAAEHAVDKIGSWVVEQNGAAREYYERHGFTYDAADPTQIKEFDGDRAGIFLFHYVRPVEPPFIDGLTIGMDSRLAERDV